MGELESACDQRGRASERGRERPCRLCAEPASAPATRRRPNRLSLRWPQGRTLHQCLTSTNSRTVLRPIATGDHRKALSTSEADVSPSLFGGGETAASFPFPCFHHQRHRAVALHWPLVCWPVNGSEQAWGLAPWESAHLVKCRQLSEILLAAAAILIQPFIPPF